MSDDAWSAYNPDADELIEIEHENPEIKNPGGSPTVVRRSALEGPGGLAESGWREAGTPPRERPAKSRKSWAQQHAEKT